MNVDSIRKIGEDLKKQAAALEAVRGQVDRLVNSSQQNWGGKDARDFAGWWRNQHRPHLEQLRQLLDGLGTSAKNNADEQERASNSGVSGAGTGDGAGGGGGSGWPADLYEDLKGQVDLYSKAMDYATLGLILKYGVDAVEGLGKATAWGTFTDSLGYLGILTGTIETVAGVVSDDWGKAWGGVVDLGIGAAGLIGGTAAAPVVIPLAVAKTFVDATIPYSDEAQNGLLDFQADRMFHTDRASLTPTQSQQLVDRYDGAMGVVNMLSDQMDKTAQPIENAGDAFFRWIGLKN